METTSKSSAWGWWTSKQRLWRLCSVLMIVALWSGAFRVDAAGSSSASYQQSDSSFLPGGGSAGGSVYSIAQTVGDWGGESTANEGQIRFSFGFDAGLSGSPQTITFEAITNTTFLTKPINLSASASSGLGVTFRVANGPATVEGNILTVTGAGIVNVVASQNGNNEYLVADEVTRTFSVAKATATVDLGSLSQTYDGAAKLASVTTDPNGLKVDVTYSGSATAPIAAGTYAVVGTVSDANYRGSASGTLVVGKGTATVTLAGLNRTYNGAAKLATGSTVPAGLPVSFTYNGSATAPTAAGSYAVVGTLGQ